MKKSIKNCLVLMLLLSFNSSIKAQTGIAVGVLLNQLMDKVENAIKLAESAGKGIIIQGGSTLYLSIENAKIAYAESLDKTFERVDQTTQGVLNELTALTTKLEQQTASDVNDIMSRAQTITNSLPFSDKQPQVGNFTPSYFAPTEQVYPVVIEFRGIFRYAANNDYQPVLIVNQKRFLPVQNTTQNLRFQIPVNELAPAFDNTFNYAQVELKVPYKTGFIFTSKKEASYKILLGILPNSPGSILIKHKIKKTAHDEERKSPGTQSWALHSSNNDEVGTFCSPGYAGWHIKDNVSFVVEWSQGNENDQWSKALISTNPQVCYKVNTIHHRFGTSGKVNFHFDFTIERDREVEEWQDETVSLKWGESKSFNYAPGTWVVVIDAFDGKHNEYSTSTASNYIDVNGSTSSLQLQIKQPARVTFH